MLSTVAQMSTVVDAIRRGASDYLKKSFEDQELALALQNVIENQERRAEVARPATAFGRRGGRLRVRQPARPADQGDRAPGRGHRRARADPRPLRRRQGGAWPAISTASPGAPRTAFVKVNCAALPEDLLESELFGYERGAFSGAMQQKPGLFELADGGTILLDEIGEMSVHLQAKLLHVLQDGEFTRLGGRQLVKVDARVLASTNVDLDQAVAAGRFREDLFFRLNVIRVEVPPLRERHEDIAPLCAHFLKQYAARYKSPLRELPRELREAFLRHDWPGNVRELENAVRRYVILGDAEASMAELRSRSRTEEGDPRPDDVPAPRDTATHGMSLRKVAAQAAEDAERRLLSRVLAETRWNRRQAASQLKISYKALLNKLKKWEVEEAAPALVAHAGDKAPGRKQGTYGFPVVPAVGARQVEGNVVAREEYVRGRIREDAVIKPAFWPRPASR